MFDIRWTLQAMSSAHNAPDSGLASSLPSDEEGASEDLLRIQSATLVPGRCSRVGKIDREAFELSLSRVISSS